MLRLTHVGGPRRRLAAVLSLTTALGCLPTTETDPSAGDGGLVADGGEGVVDAGIEIDGGSPSWENLGILTQGSAFPTDASEHEPQVAVNAEGDVMVIWQQWLPSQRKITLGYKISQDFGETWTAPTFLSPPAGANILANGRVVSLPSGGFLAVWVSAQLGYTGRSNVHLWSAMVPPGQFALGTPVEVSDPAEVVGIHDLPSVAVTPQGKIHVAWAKASVDYALVELVHASSLDGVSWTRGVLAGSGSTGSFRNGVFLCTAPSSERAFAVWFDTDVGIALSRLDQEGWSSPLQANDASDLASLAETNSTCATDGTRVWAFYGLSSQQPTSAIVPLWEDFRVARSEDAAATIAGRETISLSGLSGALMTPWFGAAANGVHHLLWYTGTGAGDTKAQIAWSQAAPDGAFTAAETLLAPTRLETYRSQDAWVGDYIGFASAHWGSIAVVTDNSSGRGHIAALRFR
jgi:hypothetical protein